MALAALIVSLIALVVSSLSVLYTRPQARAATSADMRERRPNLAVTLHEAVDSTETTAVYYVENLGAEDLDSVLVHRPKTPDRGRYPLARLGGDMPYGD